MEGKYILAIVVLGAFFLLMFISFIVLERGRIKDDERAEWISETLNNKTVKNDFESDLGAEEPVKAQSENNIDEAAFAQAEEVPADDGYGKIDVEGIEEITGNYTGDK